MRIRDFFDISIVMLLFTLVLTQSTLPPVDEDEQVRFYTRNIEFDFVGWTLNAVGVKFAQAALNSNRYLPENTQTQFMRDYLGLVGQIQQVENEINLLYTDPTIVDPEIAAVEPRTKLENLLVKKTQMAPLAESILQTQVESILKSLGLTLGGQPLPPVLYHNTPVPSALIISPRDKIEQKKNIPIQTEITLEEQIALEDAVADGLDVSTLVVPIGGIGTYPAMIYQTTNLNYLAEVVAHEWVHNFLTLRPLGLVFMENPQMRTINETTASIAGKEIGQAVIARYYPDLVPPPPPPPPEDTPENPAPPPEPPAFDFSTEMRITRVHTDELLAQGRVEEAEKYMETRRQVFWDHGYRIRKLNQAYFAFYGAYADTPGGAAGVDPVGEAVRFLRAQSDSLEVFLNQISWVTSFENLQELLESGEISRQ